MDEPGVAVEARGPGLQPERTALAWTRTAFATLANGVIALRAGYVSGSVPLLALAMTLLLGAAYTFVFASLRGRVLLGQAAAPVPRAAIAMTAAIVLAACLTGMVTVFVQHLRV